MTQMEKLIGKIKFDIGQIVYLKTDTEQRERIVLGMNIKPGGIYYSLGCGVDESWHYDFEITTQRDIIKATS